jgi:hypothetical protein
MTDLSTPQSLLKALQEAVKQPTIDELRAQSVSFIMGSVSSDSGITRADVEDALSIRAARAIHCE